MELRTASSPRDVKTYDTKRLREEFLIDDLFKADDVKLVYSHIDRIITGAATPVNQTLVLTAGDELRANYFLERREMGIINIGGTGTLIASLASLITFREYTKHNPGKTGYYMLLLIAGILTNDLHQSVFRFHKGIEIQVDKCLCSGIEGASMSLRCCGTSSLDPNMTKAVKI